MEANFVSFFSPGTLFSEETTKEINSWDVEQAVKLAKDIVERHGAKPYGFKFITRSREENELDSKVTKTSPMYYLGGKIETLEEIEKRDDPKERILRSNMRNNGHNKVVVNTNSWKFTAPLNSNDVVLDVSI